MSHGFGYGPFGHFPFGEYDWSRKVLYRTMPQLHLAKDAEYNYALKKFSEGERDPFDVLRRKMKHFTDLRDPLKVRTQYDEVETVTLGAKLVTLGTLLQRGVDGSITAFGEFTSPSIRFSSALVGKELRFSRSSIASNNVSVVVATIVSPIKAVIVPPLDEDPGPVVWELREPSTTPRDQVTLEVEFGDVSKLIPGWILFDGYANFEVLARQELTKTTEREGDDGAIDSSGRFVVSTSLLTFEDIGKRLVIFGSSVSTNNDKFEIVNVLNASPGDPYRIAELSSALTYDSGPFHWAILQKPSLTLKGTSPAVHGVIEQRGSDASITATTLTTATVHSETASYILDVSGAVASITSVLAGEVILTGLDHITSDMIGRNIAISGSANPANDGLFPVTAYLTQTSLQYRNPFAVAPDANNGSIGWRVPSPEIGKILTLLGPGSNTGTMEVSGVVSVHDLEIQQRVPALTTDAGLLYWELRTRSGFNDPLTVTVSAPAMIGYLAQDFGIVVDTQENEDRQRGWVKNVTQWLGIKGLEKGYQIPGWISGFDVTVYQLYHIIPELLPLFSSEDLVEIADGDTSRHGYDGAMYLVAPGIYGFTSPTAAFKLSDVDLCIRVTGGFVPPGSNNRLWTIKEFLDPTHVVLEPDYTPDVSDPNNGSLTWTIVRLFTHLAPMRPFFDDFDVDVFADIINTRAEVLILGSGGVSGVLFRAQVGGADGNNHRIQYVDPGAPGQPLVISTSPHLDLLGRPIGIDLTVSLATNAFSVVTSTVQDVATAVNTAVPTIFWAEAQTPTTTLAVATVFVSLVGGQDLFTPDRYCWDSAFDKSVGDTGHGNISVLSVTALEPSRFLVKAGPLTRTGPDRTYYLHEIVLSLGLQGCWKLTDSASNEYYLETLPVSSGGSSTFELIGTVAPATGPFVLEYLCEYMDLCGYCGSNRAHVIIEEDTIVGETGIAIENAFDRVVRRLVQVTPAHVLLVITFRRTLEAVLGLSAEFEPGPDTYLDLYAPLTAYYDDIPGDDIEADLYYFYATIEPQVPEYLPMENSTNTVDTFELWLP